jgi:class 3 adenylate cyclase
MASVVVTRTIEMVSSPEQVWPLLTDTDRGNRLIGTGGVTFHPIEEGSKTSARFIGETRAGGFRLVYDEYPFEWSHGKSFGVYRRMRAGPLKSYALHWTLARMAAKDGLEGGTRASVRIELEPRFAVLWPIAWINGRKFTASLVHLASAIDAHIRDNAPSPYLKPISPTNAERLASTQRALVGQGVDGALAEKIAAFVRDAADSDLIRVRPFEVADRWKMERLDVLRAFLRAVPAGMFELRWGIICPSCMTASQQVRALDEVGEEGHCHLCDLSFDLDLDRAVEATFLPHPGVRTVPDQLFCIGGPARTPHVLVQATVAPGATKQLDVPAKPGRYRVFLRGGASATLEVAEDSEPRAEASIEPTAVVPGSLVVAPGGSLVVTSRCEDERHIKIERLAFASTAATAHVVTTLGEFRTLFSSDLLKRSTPLKVAHATILFSDLTGSTALYSAVGDAAAFRLVDDHFDVLRAVIDELDGAFIKTMGDAVMAAFTDPHQCALAAIEALTRFEKFRQIEKNGERVGLKLGLFDGPCYIVTANGALDYFGQTVNVASRVQHLAGSGELVMREDLWKEIEGKLGDRAHAVEKLEARVKGVEHPLALVRLRLRDAAEQAPLSGIAVATG